MRIKNSTQTFCAILVFMCIASPLLASITLQWHDTHTDKAPKGFKYSRAQIEEAINKAANAFSEKYKDMEEFDFVNCSKEFIFTLDSGANDVILHLPGPFFSGYIYDYIYLNSKILNKKTLNEIEVMLFHEFSHLYDYSLADEIERHSRGIFTAEEKVNMLASTRAKLWLESKRDLKILKDLRLRRYSSEERAQRKTGLYVESIKYRLTPKEYEALKKPIH